MSARHRTRSIVAAAVSSLMLASGLLATGPITLATAATGDVTEFGFAEPSSLPQSIASDADGTLWMTLRGSAILAKSTLAGAISVVVSGSSNSGPDGIALGPDQRMWLAEETANRISAVSTGSGAVQTFALPIADSKPRSITAGPDGALWFTEFGSSRIGRITTAGSITEFDLAAGSGPSGITVGPDGALWFTARTGNAIGRITTAGAVTSFSLPTASSDPIGITAGPDGNLWFTESAGNRIGRMTPAGLLAEFGLPTAGALPNRIVTGADKNLWFSQTGANRIGRITPAGALTDFAIPTAGSSPIGVASAADGNVWFTESAGNRIGRVLTGVLPVATAAPAITGTSTAVGQVLTATTGSWSFRPTSYAYQWQRCTTADAASCVSVPNATGSTYTIVTADAGLRIRLLVTGTNLNGAASPAGSTLLVIDGLPPAPAPPPVIGAQAVTIAPGVTATLKGPKTARRGQLNPYAVRFSSTAVRGTVRITLVNATGAVVRVLMAGNTVKRNGVARQIARIARSTPVGQYTLRAVFTPRADQTTAYAAATMNKPLYLRR